MYVGLFGGSFNPPHLAHLLVAEAMREQFALDEVVWMPAAQSPFKTGHAATSDDRLTMTRLATEGHPAFTVSDLELQRGGLSYTLDTLEALHAERPRDTFALIVGGDNLASFTRWHRYEDILARVPLLVYHRPGYVAPSLPPEVQGRISFAEAPLLDLSSTTLRQRVAAGQSIRYRVPEPVRQYIQQHGLYLGA